MAIELVLHTNDAGQLTVTHDGEPLAGPTALDALPSLPALQGDPYGEGRALTEALGGDALLERLAADPDLCRIDVKNRKWIAPPGSGAPPSWSKPYPCPLIYNHIQLHSPITLRWELILFGGFCFLRFHICRI